MEVDGFKALSCLGNTRQSIFLPFFDGFWVTALLPMGFIFSWTGESGTTFFDYKKRGINSRYKIIKEVIEKFLREKDSEFGAKRYLIWAKNLTKALPLRHSLFSCPSISHSFPWLRILNAPSLATCSSHLLERSVCPKPSYKHPFFRSQIWKRDTPKPI